MDGAVGRADAADILVGKFGEDTRGGGLKLGAQQRRSPRNIGGGQPGAVRPIGVGGGAARKRRWYVAINSSLLGLAPCADNLENYSKIKPAGCTTSNGPCPGGLFQVLSHVTGGLSVIRTNILQRAPTIFLTPTSMIA